MSDDPGFGINVQIACVRREIAMRERVYPALVARNKMKANAAEYELRAMRAVLATLVAADRRWERAEQIAWGILIAAAGDLQQRGRLHVATVRELIPVNAKAMGTDG
jgi:hypothetical protein